MLFHVIYVFFFNDTATTEIYTLSLHDALPIYLLQQFAVVGYHGPFHVVVYDPRADVRGAGDVAGVAEPLRQDRKSTRLNSSHANISYAVFCLKKKKNIIYESFLPPLTIHLYST